MTRLRRFIHGFLITRLALSVSQYTSQLPFCIFCRLEYPRFRVIRPDFRKSFHVPNVGGIRSSEIHFHFHGQETGGILGRPNGQGQRIGLQIRHFQETRGSAGYREGYSACHISGERCVDMQLGVIGRVNDDIELYPNKR